MSAYPILSEKSLESIGLASPIGLRFEQNNKANFGLVLKMLEKTKLYQVDRLFLATFDRSNLKLFNDVLHEIREWKAVTIYANNRAHTSKFSFINWLECYLTAKECSDSKDHCREVVLNPFVKEARRELRQSLTIDIFGNEFRAVKKQTGNWNLPCKFLKPHLNFFQDDLPRAKEKLEALAVKTNCNLCPFFKADNFIQIK